MTGVQTCALPIWGDTGGNIATTGGAGGSSSGSGTGGGFGIGGTSSGDRGGGGGGGWYRTEGGRGMEQEEEVQDMSLQPPHISYQDTNLAQNITYPMLKQSLEINPFQHQEEVMKEDTVAMDMQE